MNNPQIEPANDIARVILFMNFALLVFLTISHDTFKEGYKTFATDYEKEAKQKVCDEIHALDDIYQGYARQNFIQGCVYDYMSTVYMLAREKKKSKKLTKEEKAEIRKNYENGTSYHDKMINWCGNLESDYGNSGYSTNYVRTQPLKDKFCY